MNGRILSTAAAALALLAGCGGDGDGSGGLKGSPDPQAQGPAAVCGADLPVLSQTVYVAASGTDTAGCGRSTAGACKTIAQGIASCGGAGCGVLVRHGLYATTATLDLREGVSVYGSCRFDGEADRGYRTTIQASPEAGKPAIAANGVHAPTVVRGLVVIGKDETAAGTASIAMTVSDSSGLTLTGNVLSSGRGGDGIRGGTPAGVGSGVQGAAGHDGGAGGESCTPNPTPGAGHGGHGGTDLTKATFLFSWTYNCASSDAGTAGQPSGDGTPGGPLGPKGPQGLFCQSRPHDAPGMGAPGTDGPAGACGGAAQPSPLSAGSFQGAAWVPSQGENEPPGAVGGGGGGGGAGGACVTDAQGFVYNGLPGGGGGGGGCGGGGGAGGQQGGASIPLVLVDSATPFDASANAVVPGPGGRGGSAGSGVAGGAGGAGGLGQSTGQSLYLAHWCGGPGNRGGAGGAGGSGSAGAGGHGGPSIGVAVVGATTAPSSVDAIYPARPGMPGAGGTGAGHSPGGACSGIDGSGGVAGLGAPSFNFASPPQNFLAGGQSMVTGDSRTSPNGQIQLILQTDGNLCLYRPGRQMLWCSLQANGSTGQRLEMHREGDFCLVNGPGEWCVSSGGVPGTYLLVQDDGHLVLYDGATALWTVP